MLLFVLPKVTAGHTTKHRIRKQNRSELLVMIYNYFVKGTTFFIIPELRIAASTPTSMLDEHPK